MRLLLTLLWAALLTLQLSFRPAEPPRFRVLVLAESGGHHIAYTKAATVWLNRLAKDSGFAVDYIQHTASINPGMLADYQLFIQLDYPPYGWVACVSDKECSFQEFTPVLHPA